MRLRRLCAALVATASALAGCGGGDDERGDRSMPQQPVPGQRAGNEQAAPLLGFPTFATRNTTRVGGADAIANAAAVAQAAYPGRAQESRPRVIALTDARDWRVAISAAQLMARPLRAPLLYSDGLKLPPATEQALGALRPAGAREAAGAQLIRIGRTAPAEGYKSTHVQAGDAAALAQAIDRVQTAAAGKPSAAVVVASAEQPGFAMPAAGWAAKSGDPVLWVTRDTIPAATRAALRTRKRPRIYVLGPASAISQRVLEQLDKLGSARRVAGRDPVTNAIAFARYSDGDFGWNVVDPGHGLVLHSTRRPLDAAAAAPLSATGSYGPQLLLTEANALPQALQDYLLDIQPGYDADPVRGVYNHGWIIGDQGTISIDVQARVDTLLEIQQVEGAAGS